MREQQYPLPSSPKKHRNGAKNGIISLSIRLSATIRYLAGGSVYDISLVHGISVSQVYDSIWIVIDAINSCSDLSFEFPSCHTKQKALAEGFKGLSDAGFDTCVAAIDGILIWMDRPNKKDCEEAQCGPKKFFCGRKKKFGLNMMAAVDYLGRFLDVDIRHPGSTSDFLVFATSDLKEKLGTHGFLANGLVLFGDNAYSNCQYMVTPYKSAQGSEDDFNFYQSQVRIHVECAFGKLVHRWGILRRPLSSQLGFERVTSLVIACCKLHNFCINSSNEPILDLAAQDEVTISLNEHIVLTTNPDNTYSPEGILHGGEHFDDIGPSQVRAVRRSERNYDNHLPREILHKMVVDQGLSRPNT